MTDVAFQPAVVGSAPGWPLVLYFHHVHPNLKHYTSLTPEDFARGLETALEVYGPALAPLSAARLGSPPPDHPTVLVTFDDGYRDTVDHALPALDALGVKAIFFVITDRTDEAGDDASTDPRDCYLTWADLRDLAADGHVIGAHSRTHRKLTDLGAADQEQEIAGSIRAVAARVSPEVPVPFAYPYGLVPPAAPVPPDVLGFGTVKSAPQPWPAEPQAIRRTYLPTGECETWAAMCRDWRVQWSAR